MAAIAAASALMWAIAGRRFPSGGGHLDGVLTVNCRLADATFDIEEGITLAVGGFFFVQDEGQTLFHVPK